MNFDNLSPLAIFFLAVLAIAILGVNVALVAAWRNRGRGEHGDSLGRGENILFDPWRKEEQAYEELAHQVEKFKHKTTDDDSPPEKETPNLQ